MIKIENKKILTLLQDKESLIIEGRKVSYHLEKVETKIANLTKKEKEITSKIEPKDLIDKGNIINTHIDELMKDLQKVADAIYDLKYNAIPEEIRKEHQELVSRKEQLEIDRNKIALKVQKVKDRVIPMIRKEVAPKLAEYEDIETAQIKGKTVTVKTFNHLEDWKKSWVAKNK